MRVHIVRRAAHPLAAAALALLLPLGAAAAQGGTPPDSARRDSSAVPLAPITVTATRTPTDVFHVPTPVAVLDRGTLSARAANSIADAFRDVPGLDVSGVGPNQVRPIIRGQRGQRILLLSDGLRLNNSRRQQDFGEIPGLIDVGTVERVEVVRGPASVLYGTDAIGGVVNVITRRSALQGFQGSAGYRFSTHDDQHRVSGTLSGRLGDLSIRATGTFRDASGYAAPAGTFGDITLAGETRVRDTGLEDRSLGLDLGYRLGAGHDVFVRYERYDADTAGFGYVDPADYAPNQPFIQIRYPTQTFDRVSAGYSAVGLGWPVADGLEVIGYVQDNDRELALNVFAPFGPTAPPGAGIQIDQRNATDLATYGFRVEARKLLGTAVMLTYGADLFRDRSNNSDTNVTTVVGFGPPMSQTSATPLVPNATYRSVGGFVQAETRLTSRATLIVGGRYQDVRAATQPTPGVTAPLLSSTDRTVVASVNGIYALTDQLSAIATVGRAFRSPNLVERFFDGPTPEGVAYQSPNPDLEPETSLNVDLGLRYRDRRVSAEAFVFRNKIFDGVRIAPTGDSIFGLPEFENVNVDELRFQGIEVAADVWIWGGLTVGANYTRLDAKDALNPLNPIGDSFSSRLVARLRYQLGDRLWAEYALRHNGERKDVDLGRSPIGATLPAFTVHDVRAGATLFRVGPVEHRVQLVVRNLTDELYAEFANASFFRPEPGRSVALGYEVRF